MPKTTISYAAKLADQLQAFLLRYDISIESGIVGYAMQELTGVRFNNSRMNDGFDFSYYRDNEEFLNYRIPQISLEEYQQLALYFAIPKDRQKISNIIEVSQQIMEEKVLPQLKDFIDNLKTNNAELFMTFVIASKPKLERMAYDEIKIAAHELKEYLLNNPVHSKAEIMQAVVAISAANSNIEQYAGMYDLLFAEAKNRFTTALQTLVPSNNDLSLNKACRFLLEGVNRFEKYNRCRSIIAGESMMRDLQNVAESLNVSTANSDLFEHTLLKLAGVVTIPKKCSFKIGSDKSRLVFDFSELNADEQQKLITFLKSKGDDTAKAGYGYQEWNHYRPSGGSVNLEMALDVQEMGQFSPQSAIYSQKRIKVQPFSLECDALSFYNTVYPDICSTLRSTHEQNPEALKPYRLKDISMFNNLEMAEDTDNNNNFSYS